MAILFLIGQKKEKPEIIKEMLDVKKHPRKPNYPMASELPLILKSCEFEGLNFKISKGNVGAIYDNYM